MKKLLHVILVLLVSVGSLYSADLMNSKKLFEVKRIGEFRVSPDETQIAFVITIPDVEENTFKSNIYLISAKGGEPRQITSSGKSNSNPCWSPKGDKLAFLSDRNDKSQVYILDMNAGGEAKQITFMENGVSNLSYSPDGKHLAFTSDVKIEQSFEEKYPEYNKAKAYIYDDIPFRHWDHYLDEKYRHLFVVPVEGGDPLDLMKGEPFDTPLKPFGGKEQIAWAPNGTEIAYVSKKGKDYEQNTNSDIFVVNVYGGKPKNITAQNLGFDLDPIYSPNGKNIAYLSMQRPGFESDRQRLMYFIKSSGRTKEVTEGFDHSVKHPVWKTNSNGFYWSAANGDGTNQIYESGMNPKSWSTITQGVYNFGDRGIELSKDGKTLYFSRRNMNRPAEVFSMDIKSKKIQQLTNVNDDMFKNIKEAKIETRWVNSTDGKKVHCWVVYPPDFNPSKKYPVITYCQGGPQQEISQYWSYGWNFLTMASEGYIVLAPNRRGCPGFGQDWVDAISKDYGGMPMQDIIAATRDLATEPYVDKNRIAAVGASAGGYAVFWLAGNHQGLFKAFISHCGMFNMVSKYGSTEELWFPNWDNGGPYWEPEHAQYYVDHSPHTYARNWDTPILIITGELDYRVPYTQSLEAFTAARARDVPARIIVYPQENHWILHPQEKLLWYDEFFRFLNLYMK